MTAPIVTFFNNKGGVGKTSLVYHLGWMLADLGHRVVVADLDPQTNLTSAFLDENELEWIWPLDAEHRSVWGALRPFHEREESIGPAPLARTDDDRLALLPGDLALSTFEDDLAEAWSGSMDGKPGAFRTMSAFWTVLSDAARKHDAEIVLVDVGPSLGSVNRAALVASDYVVIPLALDLIGLQGLRNLGPTLREWRSGWANRLVNRPPSDTPLPAGRMAVIGYVVLGQGVRLNRPGPAYQRRMNQIPEQFRTTVLDLPHASFAKLEDDPYCLAQLKHYHSLLLLAQEARKPVFHLKPADGAFGGHAQAAQSAYLDFEKLASEILERVLPER
jgi:cellulose biosynthesis protein BcsQ